MNKLIVISAPSGAGKTSIVQYLLKKLKNVSFSISACSRKKRSNEKQGIDYNFLSAEEFREKINQGAFLEWEEVYDGQYYGTLKSELERIWQEKKSVIFDLDVVGGINIKNQYPENCLSIFIMPPSLEELEKRLKNRGSESIESLNKRLKKAKLEILQSKEFDKVIINDEFDKACEEVKKEIEIFIG